MFKSSIAVLALCALTAAMLFGCASGPQKPTDEELIRGQLDTLTNAVFAKDIDKALSTLSDSFSQGYIGDKAAVKPLIQMGIDMKVIDGAKVDFTKMQIKVTGDKAVAGPITASGSTGSVSAELTLQKEKKGWMITGGNEI